MKLHDHELFNDGATVAVNVRRPPANTTVHAHDFLEILLIGSGSAYHVTAQGCRPMRAGDLFILRPGTWHQYTEGHQLVAAHICIASSELHGDAALLHQIPVLHDLLWLRPALTNHYGVYAAHIPEPDAAETVRQIAILEYDLTEGTPSRLLLLGRLFTILGTMVEHMTSDCTDRGLHPAVVAARTQLDTTPGHDWKLDELASTVHLTPEYLSRLFRHHLGLPPMAYLARIRTERAATLLAQTSESISHIGALVGWPNPTHFTHRFRTLSGLTPTEYRQRSRNNPHPATGTDQPG